MKPTSTPSESRNEFLSKVSLFQDIRGEPRALEILASTMIERSFDPGKDILVEGQTGSEIFFLMEGDASVFKSTIEGERYKVALIHADQHPFFGEGGLLDSEARSATIRAESGCRCLVLNRDAFLSFAKDHPQWALPVILRIARAVMSRLRKTNNDLLLLYNALVSEIRGT